MVKVNEATVDMKSSIIIRRQDFKYFFVWFLPFMIFFRISMLSRNLTLCKIYSNIVFNIHLAYQVILCAKDSISYIDIIDKLNERWKMLHLCLFTNDRELS